MLVDAAPRSSGLRRSRGRSRSIGDLGLDAAGVGAEHDDAVGEQDGFFDVVGDDQHGLGGEVAAGPQLEQLAAQVLGGEDVERAERLVHEQRRRARRRARGRSRRAGACRRRAPWGRRTRSRRGRSGRSRAGARSCALGAGTPRASRPSSTFCWTVSQGSSAKVWKTMRDAGVGADERLPAVEHAPVGRRRSGRRCSAAASTCRSPDLPSSATISPSCSSRSMPSSTGSSPSGVANVLRTSRVDDRSCPVDRGRASSGGRRSSVVSRVGHSEYRVSARR